MSYDRQGWFGVKMLFQCSIVVLEIRSFFSTIVCQLGASICKKIINITFIAVNQLIK